MTRREFFSLQGLFGIGAALASGISARLTPKATSKAPSLFIQQDGKNFQTELDPETGMLVFVEIKPNV